MIYSNCLGQDSTICSCEKVYDYDYFDENKNHYKEIFNRKHSASDIDIYKNENYEKFQ